jgi:hypothetical protein
MLECPRFPPLPPSIFSLPGLMVFSYRFGCVGSETRQRFLSRMAISCFLPAFYACSAGMKRPNPKWAP